MAKKIKEYSKIEAGIAALAEKYAIVPDCSVDAGLTLCKKSYREIRKFEIDLDAKRKELGSEARLHLKAIGDEAKSIDNRLKVISTPFKLAFEQREQELKEAEELRIAAIKARIEQLNDFIVDAQSADSQGVTAITEAIDLIDCAEGFEEFTAEALKTKQSVLSQLGVLLQNKLAFEGAERERIAAEKMQQEFAVQQQIESRINNLRMIPIGFMGKSAAEISAKLNNVTGYIVQADEFGDRYQEAVDAKDQVTQQLSTMLTNQQLVEDAQAKKEEAERKQQAEQQIQADNDRQQGCVSEAPAQEPHFTMPTGRKQQPAPQEISQADYTITITATEYDQLKRDSAELAALRTAGVDNWDGYDVAISSLNQAA